MLERDGYRVDVAHDAAEVRRLLAERSYAALTLDLRLPDQDGVSLIRELRSNEATRRLPIVVVSVRAEEGQAELNGGALGVVDWLVKPIDEQRLRRAMERAVRSPLGAGARILHVEDDLDLQRVVAAIVDGDAVVEQALDLAGARERLARQRFDLVILDLALPDGSGLDLLPLIGEPRPADAGADLLGPRGGRRRGRPGRLGADQVPDLEPRADGADPRGAGTVQGGPRTSTDDHGRART